MLHYLEYVVFHIPAYKWITFVLLYFAMEALWWLIKLLKEQGLSCSRHLMVVAIALIVWPTLCLRAPGMEHRVNLVPFWSWYQGFSLDNDEIRWQIYFNILLFVPYGCLLYLSKPRPLSKILLQGFLLSLIIELCQLMFKLGLFEWDDMLHNSLGCLLGGFAAKTIERVWNLHRLHKTAGRK